MPTAESDDDENCISCMCIYAYLVAFVVNMAMVVVGWQYRDSCTIEIIPLFLQIGGGVMLGLTTLYLVCSVCGICCCGEEEGTTNFRAAYIIG